ncbi:MAG: hypothetical protein HOP91_01305 [Sphingomonas sp.]|nr:hypothetical protein [Sphingomonas sp.]
MNVPALLISIAGAACIAQGLWMLAVRPDPPAGAGAGAATTRRGRQVTGIALVILGVFGIAANASSIAFHASSIFRS